MTEILPLTVSSCFWYNLLCITRPNCQAEEVVEPCKDPIIAETWPEDRTLSEKWV
jgi:hypothetical protein